MGSLNFICTGCWELLQTCITWSLVPKKNVPRPPIRLHPGTCLQCPPLVTPLVLFINYAINIDLTLLDVKSNYYSNQICNTPECLRSAANLMFSMDTSVDPCEDFYQFSCGHWSEEHPNHGWYPKFSNFETIEERISIATMKFLESNSSVKDPLPVKQCRDFYRSCMDVGKQKPRLQPYGRRQIKCTIKSATNR